MGVPYAEVIGDPIAHSKSPLIHKFWLGKLAIRGDYRAHSCSAGGVARYMRDRCADPFWRGCNVTAPLKLEAARSATDPMGIASRVGAANALFRSPLGCAIAANTDLNGIAEVLDLPANGGGPVCLIGAGGAARAVLEVLRMRQISEVTMIVRDVDKGRRIQRAFGMGGNVSSFGDPAAAIRGAKWLINSTPLGMVGHPAMPPTVLDLLTKTLEHALVFDMVYVPLETELLRRASEIGRRTADGVAMLIGQAAPAFELFFGQRPPRAYDVELRELLTR
jgi:shikimate dehydrogenase